MNRIKDGGFHRLVEVADNLGFVSGDNSKVADQTDGHGGHGDIGGVDTGGLDGAVAAPDNDDEADMGGQANLAQPTRHWTRL